MKLVLPLAVVLFSLSCNGETNQTGKASAAPALEAKTALVQQIRYHCSESASGNYAVLFLGIFNHDGTSMGKSIRISGLIPILECRSRTRSYVRAGDQVPSLNYYCEIDSSGTAMLFEQSITLGIQPFFSTRKVSKALSRGECSRLAKEKQDSSGKTWQRDQVR